MSRLMEMAGDKVHSRDISISTHPADNDCVVVEGVLLEKRLKEYYLLTGEKKPANVLHHMVLRMLLEGPTLIIREVEVEMPGVPRDACLEMRESLAPIVGLSITSGFTGTVRRLVGGVKGCFHLTSLLLAMAPAAVQGYWSNRASKPTFGESKSPERLKQLPLNTCYVWREDGPLVEKIKKEFDLL